MSNKLFVGGLAWATTNESLRAAFEPYGEVVDARVIMDRDTGRSRGFGFVTFSDAESANNAREKMDGSAIDGRNVRVNEAQERAPRRGGPGGGGGGDRRGGPPPRRDRGERSYPPVERRSGGPPSGGGDFGGPPPGDDPFGFGDGKPAGRKRHNGGKRRKGAGKGDWDEGGGGGGGGGRRRRGGGRRGGDDFGDW